MFRRLAVVLLLVPVICSANPISEEKLLQMVDAKVDTDLIVSIVQRDCVSFKVDADTLISWNGKIDKKIIEAILECSKRDQRDSASSSPDKIHEPAEVIQTAAAPEQP